MGEAAQFQPDPLAERTRLRLAFEALHAGVWEWDLRTNQNYWSDELWTVYGLAPHSCAPSYEAWRKVVYEEDRAAAEQAVVGAARNGAEIHFEFRVKDGNGGLRWLLSRGQPERDAAGQAVRYCGIVVDITHRKRAEESLRDSEARYRMLHETQRDAFVRVTMDGRIVECNDIYCEMLGYSREELGGLTYVQLTPERWHGVEEVIVREQILARGYSDVYEKEYRRKDGLIIPVELRTILGRRRRAFRPWPVRRPARPGE